MSPRRARSAAQPDDRAGVPGVQVGAEAARAHAGGEVDVGGRHHAHVGVDDARAAHRHVLVVLEDAQQLGLLVQRQLADLVEEDGAALGLAEEARRVGGCAGEGPAAMAEERGLGELAWAARRS
jgi:hypothetical protein